MSKLSDQIADVLDENEKNLETSVNDILKIKKGIHDDLIKEVKLLFARYKNEDGIIEMTTMQEVKFKNKLNDLLNKYSDKVSKEEYALLLGTLSVTFWDTQTAIGEIINTEESNASDDTVDEYINAKVKGKDLKTRIKDNTKGIFSDYKTAIIGAVGGKKLLNQVVDAMDKVKQKSNNTTRNVATTECVRMTNESIINNLEENDIDEVEWVIERDNRTCEHCKEKEGKTYKITDVFQKPPLHPRCRCILIPKKK